MMMAMNSLSSKNRPEPYSIDSKIAEMFHKQQEMLNRMSAPKRTHDRQRRIMMKIKRLENMIEDVLTPEDERNPMLDMFFLQNVMMSQNSIQSQFNPDNDERSKRLQGFMMAQMMKQMAGVRNQNVLKLKVKIELNFRKKNKMR